jgi:hypothetical protein
MTNPFTFICGICGLRKEPCEHWEQQEVIRLLREEMRFNRVALLDIIHLLRATLIYPRGMQIKFVQENQMSTPAGGTSVFQEVPTPAGSVFPSGTTFTWTVDDTADITLTPTSDGTGVTAVCVASPAATSYNLTCTSSYTPPGAPTPISATLNVPITAAPPVTPTGMTINQTS